MPYEGAYQMLLLMGSPLPACLVVYPSEQEAWQLTVNHA